MRLRAAPMALAASAASELTATEERRRRLRMRRLCGPLAARQTQRVRCGWALRIY